MPDDRFTHVVDAHYASLYRFALSLARHPADAGDLTQQTFFIWASKGDTLRDPAKAKTWLFTTLYREFLRGRRRDGRVIAIEDLAPEDREIADVTADQVEKLDAPLVLEALQEVDEVFRAPLVLFYLQDVSYLEIAEILDVPIGTVMSRLSRGKAQLRARLAAKAPNRRIVEFPPARIRT